MENQWTVKGETIGGESSCRGGHGGEGRGAARGVPECIIEGRIRFLTPGEYAGRGLRPQQSTVNAVVVGSTINAAFLVFPPVVFLVRGRRLQSFSVTVVFA